MQFWLYIIIFLVTVLFTIFLRIYALSRDIIDIPNDRSSHTTPTPRGGVSIVIAFTVAIILCIHFELLAL